ncbi:carbohydrate ABC transporter permease [Athalassotoga saccharophila]|uniref:carbohydrate ABC transporter permease n=1 Tax=Athalassotoga saccharophila TaxID=1441386 RepID=UPI00137A0FB1|nr:carbohydrate ABC transporter permease [Athalassotoga saccharophila]BBJ28775.1 trehalose transport system permease protein SugB [Athalassotoga saccharophila]
MRPKTKRRIVNSVRYIFTILILVVFLFPAYWITITAFKPSSEWNAWPPHFWPYHPTLSNFFGGSSVSSIEGILPFLRNSLVVSTAVAVIAAVIALLAAYSIARFKTGGMGLAGWIISMRMLPPVTIVIPLYVIYAKVNLLNTWTGLILIYLVPAIALGVWILITFINQIPKELDEAAKIDGASNLQTFTHIILPLSLSGFAAVMVLTFIQTWSEFLLATILTSNSAAQTLPVYLGRFITGYNIAWGALSAAGLITMLPVIIFGIIFQRYLIRGLTFGAVKY